MCFCVRAYLPSKLFHRFLCNAQCVFHIKSEKRATTGCRRLMFGCICEINTSVRYSIDFRSSFCYCCFFFIQQTRSSKRKFLVWTCSSTLCLKKSKKNLIFPFQSVHTLFSAATRNSYHNNNINQIEKSNKNCVFCLKFIVTASWLYSVNWISVSLPLPLSRPAQLPHSE